MPRDTARSRLARDTAGIASAAIDERLGEQQARRRLAWLCEVFRERAERADSQTSDAAEVPGGPVLNRAGNLFNAAEEFIHAARPLWSRLGLDAPAIDRLTSGGGQFHDLREPARTWWQESLGRYRWADAYRVAGPGQDAADYPGHACDAETGRLVQTPLPQEFRTAVDAWRRWCNQPRTTRATRARWDRRKREEVAAREEEVGKVMSELLKQRGQRPMEWVYRQAVRELRRRGVRLSERQVRRVVSQGRRKGA